MYTYLDHLIGWQIDIVIDSHLQQISGGIRSRYGILREVLTGGVILPLMPSRFTPARQLPPLALRPHRPLPRQVQAGWVVMGGSGRIWLVGKLPLLENEPRRIGDLFVFGLGFGCIFSFKLPVETMYWNSSPELKSFLSTGDFQDETLSTQWIYTYVYIYIIICIHVLW